VSVSGNGAGWPEVELGDLLTRIEAGQNFKCEGRPPTDQEVGIVKVSAVTWGEYDEEETKTVTDGERVAPKLFVQRGDFLFSRANTIQLVGACVIARQVTKRIMLSDKILRFHFRGVDPAWVLYFLRSLRGRRQIESLATGNQESMRNIGQERIRSITLPLPSEREQRLVLAEVEKQLTRIDAGVAALTRVQANLKRYRASVLKAACEGRLVPTEDELARRESRDYEPASVLLQRILKERRHHWEASELAKLKAKGKRATDDRWKAKYREPNPPDMAALPELPAGWCWANIGQLADVGTGATPKRGHAAYYEGGTIPWVTSSVVNQHSVASATEFVTQLALRDTNLTVYPPGTLLLAMYGEGKTRGRVSELAIAAATNQALAALEFRGAALECKPFARLRLEAHYLDLRLAASGGVQPNINLEIVRAIAVPLPPSVERDRIEEEVGRRMSLVDGLGECARRNLVRAGNVRNAILNAAFAGKLTSVATLPRSNPTSKASERVALRSTPNTNVELADA
jgi:type I restriction enzyme S subunit